MADPPGETLMEGSTPLSAILTTCIPSGMAVSFHIFGYQSARRWMKVLREGHPDSSISLA